MDDVNYKDLCGALFGTTDVNELAQIADALQCKNPRHAGRKRKFSDDDIAEMRRLQKSGVTITEIATRYRTSRQTIGKYINPPPDPGYTLRLTLMNQNQPCTTIDVDFLRQRIKIQNRTKDIQHCAFGVKADPSWDDFLLFLQNRCQFNNDEQLKEELGHHVSNFLQIVKDTQGRTPKDDLWLRFQCFEAHSSGQSELPGVDTHGQIEDAKCKKTAPAKAEAGNNTRLSESDLDEYLQVGMRRHVRNTKDAMITSGNSPILTTPEKIKSFISDSIAGRVRDTIKGYGRVGQRFQKEVSQKTNGTSDISDFYLELDSNRIQHLSDHILDDGDLRNIPLTRDQVLSIPDYIDNYDDVLDVITRKDGQTRIYLGKQINGHSVVVVLVSKGRSSVQPVTAWQNTTEHYLKKTKGAD